MKTSITLLAALLSLSAFADHSSLYPGTSSGPSSGYDNRAPHEIELTSGSRIYIRAGVPTTISCEGGSAALTGVKTSCVCSVDEKNSYSVNMILVTVGANGSVTKQSVASYPPTGYSNSYEVNSDKCRKDLQINPLCK